jgi:TPR repeat protein
MYDLGRMYEMGWGGARDSSQASALYKKAAERGNAEAKAGVARLSGESK